MIDYKGLPSSSVEKCRQTRRERVLVCKTGVGKSLIRTYSFVWGNSYLAEKDKPEKRWEAEKKEKKKERCFEYDPDGSNCVVLKLADHEREPLKLAYHEREPLKLADHEKELLKLADHEKESLKFATNDTPIIIYVIDTGGVSEGHLMTEPKFERLFLSNNLSKTGCPIVTFPVGLSKATNETIAELKKSGLGKEKMIHVLTAISTSSSNDASTDMEENQQLKFILLEHRLLSSPAGSSQQSCILRELTTEFVITLEGQLQRGLVPHSDAKMVTLLPFRADMRDYLPNMSFFVLQVSFPISLLKKRIALLLLASRVLYTSLEDSLAEVMCEDQALVMQRSSAFLVTENHAIEALIQFSQLQNVFWYIVSYNSEKCSMEMMEKVQDTLQQSFRDEFPSKEFSIEPLSNCQQQPSNESTAPKEMQQIKTAVEESQSDSGQIYLLVTVNTKFVEPEPGI